MLLAAVSICAISACGLPPAPTLTSQTTGAGGTSVPGSTGGSPSGTTPIPPPYRNPIQERNNALNAEPGVPNDVTFPELERIRSEYLIPESAEVSRLNVRAAAMAFGAAVLDSVRNPKPSGLNLALPGHPRLVTIPAGLNALGRAAMHQRDGVSGVDVGPSVPDSSGRVWVALFMGASGPVGRVEAYCAGVTLRSDGGIVYVEVEEVASSVVRQPKDRKDFVDVSCVLDLEARTDDGFATGL